jgi:hypothetical protein
MFNFLQQTDHRPWPMLTTPWIMTQVWHNLLFAHWPLAPETLRRVIPPQLEVDTFEGMGYLAVVPFGMSDVYPRYTFAVPGLSNFLELNVRTYVRVGNKPGVYFFSLDAAQPMAVALARVWYQLPYYNARMKMALEDADWRRYHSLRTHAGSPHAELVTRYRPSSPVYFAERGSLEHWLTERYCLYTLARGQVYRGEIHHAPWPLQRAEAQFRVNTMTLPPGLPLPNPRHPPLLHFVRRIETVEWPIAPVET